MTKKASAEKSAEAFRTIHEVALLLNVPKHVLRFWETRFSSIRPLKRGGGRRYYRPQDLDLLRGIRHLLQVEAYTIKGVQNIFRDHGVDYVKALGAAPEAVTGEPDKKRRRKRPEPSAPSPALAASLVATTARQDRQTVLASLLDQLLTCRRILRGEAPNNGEPDHSVPTPQGRA